MTWRRLARWRTGGGLEIAVYDEEGSDLPARIEAAATATYPRGNDGTDGLEDGHWAVGDESEEE